MGTSSHQGVDMDKVEFQEASLVCHLALSTAMFPSEMSKNMCFFLFDNIRILGEKDK